MAGGAERLVIIRIPEQRVIRPVDRLDVVDDTSLDDDILLCAIAVLAASASQSIAAKRVLAQPRSAIPLPLRRVPTLVRAATALIVPSCFNSTMLITAPMERQPPASRISAGPGWYGRHRSKEPKQRELAQATAIAGGRAAGRREPQRAEETKNPRAFASRALRIQW